LEDKDFFQSVLDAMRDMVLVKGPKSRLLWANKSFLDYYGLSKEELAGIVDGPQSDPDNTLQYVRDDKFVFDTQKDLNVPSEPVTNAAGETNYFHTIKTPLFRGDTMTQIVGVSRRIEDKGIQEQKLSEIDAKVFTAPLRSIIDNFPVPTMLTDHDLRIIKCNSKWAEFFGSKPIDPNVSFGDQFEFLGELSAKAQECLDSKSDVEVVIQIKDGRSKIYFDFKISPWKYPNGDIGGVMIVANDVTSIIENKEAMANLHETINDGYWNWKVQDGVNETSPRYWQMLGFDPTTKEPTIEEAMTAIHPEDRQRVLNAMEKHFDSKGEVPFNEKIRFGHADGSLVWVNCRGKVVEWDSLGKPIRMVGAHTDVSEIVNTLEDLMRANEDLTQFAYASSHDLKAPLTTSKSLTECVLQDIDDGDLDEAKKNLNKIHLQMERLENLVTDILSLAQADFKETELEPVNFEEMLGAIEEKLGWIHEDSDFLVKKEISRSEHFKVDKTRVVQILENLLSNAMKYRDNQKPSQFVSINISTSQNELQIVVKDNGLGIPEKHQTDLFKMFKRFHPKTAIGSGLGLSIVKRNVDRMGGAIRAESSPEGSIFTIDIPNQENNR